MTMLIDKRRECQGSRVQATSMIVAVVARPMPPSDLVTPDASETDVETRKLSLGESGLCRAKLALAHCSINTNDEFLVGTI